MTNLSENMADLLACYEFKLALAEYSGRLVVEFRGQRYRFSSPDHTIWHLWSNAAAAAFGFGLAGPLPEFWPEFGPEFGSKDLPIVARARTDGQVVICMGGRTCWLEDDTTALELASRW